MADKQTPRRVTGGQQAARAATPPANLAADGQAAEALDIARAMAAAGIPVFVAYPDPDGRTASGKATGFTLPSNWEKTTANPAYVNAWRPGMALCAVMGQGLDLVDIDPRNGGDAASLNGITPEILGEAGSPSGGDHLFVRSMGVRSRDGVLPGIDVKGGDADGGGRGYAFIAPTVRPSKVTGQPAAYRWVKPPDLSRLGDGDGSGEQLAALVRQAHGSSRQPSADQQFAQPGAPRKHAGPIPYGQHHAALVRYAGWLRDKGVPLQPEAEVLMLRRLQDCVQPPGAPRARYTEGEALAELHDVYRRYAEGQPAEAADDQDVDGALQGAVNARKAQLRIEQLAREQLAAEGTPAVPAAVSGADFLAQPDDPQPWRITGLMPAGGNVMLAAQYKAGKTTFSGNLLRSWCDGAPFLGTYQIDPAAGPILLIDTEMSRDTARRWLRAHGIQNADRFRYVNLRGAAAALNMTTAAGRRQWAAIAQGCSAVLLDCIGPVLGALNLDENHNPDVLRFFAGWDEMLATAGIAESLVIHHMGHNGERSRGASRFRDWPDAEWRLVRQDDNPASPRYFSAFGRDVEIAESRLEFDETARRLTLAGGSRKEASATAAAAAIRDLLDTSPGLSANKIEQALGGEHARNGIRSALTAAAKSGEVRTEPGPHGSRLHYLSSPARRSSPPRGGEVSPVVRRSYKSGELARSPAGPDHASQSGEVRASCPRCFAPIVSGDGHECDPAHLGNGTDPLTRQRTGRP